MNVNSPVVIALARKNGCSELDALLSLRGSRQVSTVFAYNPNLLTVEEKSK